jgi:hypothetical protein
VIEDALWDAVALTSMFVDVERGECDWHDVTASSRLSCQPLWLCRNIATHPLHNPSLSTSMSSREPLWYCHEVCLLNFHYYPLQLLIISPNKCNAEMRPLMACMFLDLIALHPNTILLGPRPNLRIMPRQLRRAGVLSALYSSLENS